MKDKKFKQTLKNKQEWDMSEREKRQRFEKLQKDKKPKLTKKYSFFKVLRNIILCLILFRAINILLFFTYEVDIIPFFPNISKSVTTQSEQDTFELFNE